MAGRSRKHRKTSKRTPQRISKFKVEIMTKRGRMNIKATGQKLIHIRDVVTILMPYDPNSPSRLKMQMILYGLFLLLLLAGKLLIQKQIF